MTGRFAVLCDINSINPCYIGLQNGSQTMANFEGSVKLGSKLILHLLLCVPNLICNLVSIS